MKITHLRCAGYKVGIMHKDAMSRKLNEQLAKAGFITEVESLSKIGLRSKCFTIDTEMLGYNKSVRRRNGFYEPDNGIVGFKKTQLPTWDQRVEFNDIINAFFDVYDLTAKIVSGAFLVRCHLDGAQTEDHWLDTHNPWEGRNEISTLEDGDVAEAKELRKEHNRNKRLQKKSIGTPEVVWGLKLVGV